MENMKGQAEKIVSISKGIESHAKFLSNIRIGVNTIRTPIQNTMEQSSPGKKLITLGFALTVLSPDPFTDIAGIPLMVAGLAINRRKSSIGIQDVAKELSRSCEGLRNLKLDL